MTLTPVRVRDCACPDTPHDGHHILVSPTLSMQGGIEAEQVWRDLAVSFPDVPESASEAEKKRQDAANILAITYAWAPIFVRHGAKDWDFCDEQGNPIPFDIEAVLADYSIARLVADKCADLGYGSAVMAPFLGTSVKPSRNGRTPATTSRRRQQTRG